MAEAEARAELSDQHPADGEQENGATTPPSSCGWDDDSDKEEDEREKERDGREEHESSAEKNGRKNDKETSAQTQCEKTAEGSGGGDFGAQEFERLCRICHSCDEDEQLISPCLCKGSGRWVHRKCLQEWRVKSSRADSYHTCELCQHQYTVTCAGWARALCHDAVQIALTTLLLLCAISLGALVWEVLARLFVSLCNESDDSFRFAIRVMGTDIGFLFGGVIMAKIGVIILQLFKHDTPEVQNMVGFLAFIVFLVQSRVFAPVQPSLLNSTAAAAAAAVVGEEGGGGRGERGASEGGEGGHERGASEVGIYLIQLYAPHYFLAVYTATTFRWCFSVVSRVAVWAQRTATTVESFKAS